MYVLLVKDLDTGGLIQVARGYRADLEKLLPQYFYTFAFITCEVN